MWNDAHLQSVYGDSSLTRQYKNYLPSSSSQRVNPHHLSSVIFDRVWTAHTKRPYYSVDCLWCVLLQTQLNWRWMRLIWYWIPVVSSCCPVYTLWLVSQTSPTPPILLPSALDGSILKMYVCMCWLHLGMLIMLVGMSWISGWRLKFYWPQGWCKIHG